MIPSFSTRQFRWITPSSVRRPGKTSLAVEGSEGGGTAVGVAAGIAIASETALVMNRKAKML